MKHWKYPGAPVGPNGIMSEATLSAQDMNLPLFLPFGSFLSVTNV